MGLAGVAAIEIGEPSRCALLEDGTVTCWDWELEPQPVEGLSDVTSIAVGDEYACA